MATEQSCPFGPGTETDVYLVAFKLRAGDREPELYTLYMMDRTNDEDSPLLDCNGRLLLCEAQSQIKDLAKLADKRFHLLRALPQKVHYVYDLNESVISLVEGYDRGGSLSSLMVFVLDFLEQSILESSEEDYTIVSDFFCHIFESPGTVHEFLRVHEYTRQELFETLSNVHYIMFASARYLRSDGSRETCE